MDGGLPTARWRHEASGFRRSNIHGRRSGRVLGMWRKRPFRNDSDWSAEADNNLDFEPDYDIDRDRDAG